MSYWEDRGGSKTRYRSLHSQVHFPHEFVMEKLISPWGANCADGICCLFLPLVLDLFMSLYFLSLHKTFVDQAVAEVFGEHANGFSGLWTWQRVKLQQEKPMVLFVVVSSCTMVFDRGQSAVERERRKKKISLARDLLNGNRLICRHFLILLLVSDQYFLPPNIFLKIFFICPGFLARGFSCHDLSILRLCLPLIFLVQWRIFFWSPGAIGRC